MWNNSPIIKIIDFSTTTQKDCPKPFQVCSHKQNVNQILIFSLFMIDNQLILFKLKRQILEIVVYFFITLLVDKNLVKDIILNRKEVIIYRN